MNWRLWPFFFLSFIHFSFVVFGTLTKHSHAALLSAGSVKCFSLFKVHIDKRSKRERGDSIQYHSYAIIFMDFRATTLFVCAPARPFFSLARISFSLDLLNSSSCSLTLSLFSSLCSLPLCTHFICFCPGEGGFCQSVAYVFKCTSITKNTRKKNHILMYMHIDYLQLQLCVLPFRRAVYHSSSLPKRFPTPPLIMHSITSSGRSIIPIILSFIWLSIMLIIRASRVGK